MKIQPIRPVSRKFVVNRIFTVLVLLSSYSFLSAQNFDLNWYRQALVVDTHTDAIYSHLHGRSIEVRSDKGHVDLIRLAEGGVDVQFFALWPDPRQYKPDKMYRQTVTLLDSVTAVVSRNPDKVRLCRNPAEIEQTVADGKIAACMGIEGGTAIENSLDKLVYFYNRGVRYLGLTWNDSNDWASSAKDETDPNWQGHKGLTDFGRKVIRKMNELGMIVDLSHSGEQTFYDVLKITTKPVICSHSCVYAICPHFRNLKDDQLKALAENGGVIFINFYPGYLVKDFDRIYMEARKRATAIQDSLKNAGSSEPFDRAAYIHSQIDSLKPDVGTLADHIDYVVRLIGDDHVGLGSDFDGISITPNGLEDVTKMPEIAKELLRRGYSRESVEKILGGNFMRVFRSVQAGKK